MAIIAGNSRALQRAQIDFRRDAIRLFTALHSSLERHLTRFSDGEGIIPSKDQRRLVRAINRSIGDMFVGRGRAPFERDHITPTSPFTIALMRQIDAVTLATVMAQQDWMDRNVPGDVLLFLSRGRERRVVVEQRQSFGPEHPIIRKYRDTFVDTDLLSYDDAHPFVPPHVRGPDGYRLSDRVWRVNDRTRARVDNIVMSGIRQGEGAARISKVLESSLIPGRKLIRTRTPYNRNASFDAMRLARTEVTAAAGRAAVTSSNANPYVDRMQWKLSQSHPRVDICDSLADTYFIAELPAYPAHPHCLCVLVPVTARSPQQVSDDMRALIEESEGAARPFVNPADANAFTRYILRVAELAVRTGAARV